MYISGALYSISMLPFRKSFLDLMHLLNQSIWPLYIHSLYIYKTSISVTVVVPCLLNKLLLVANDSWFAVLSSCTCRNNNLWNVENDKSACKYIYIYIYIYACFVTWSVHVIRIKVKFLVNSALWQNRANFNKS